MRSETSTIKTPSAAADKIAHTWAVQKGDGEWLISDGFGIIGSVADHGDALRIIVAVNSHEELLEACKFLFGEIESGNLVRDITRDGQSADWSMRMMNFTMNLGKAQAALAKVEGK